MSAISLSIRDAAIATGLGERSIRKEIDGGRIPAKKYGTKILILSSDLEAFIKSLENARN